VVALLGAIAALTSCRAHRPLDGALPDVLAPHEGALVIVDCSSGAMRDLRPSASAEPLPPCSTFKIWNTLIAIECGVISGDEEVFYRWDGKVRDIADWNRDLSLKEAFQVSCVPAFQDLARAIGPERMKFWLDTISYGDGDTSSGADVFWLPAPGRKTLRITPRDQAQRMCELLTAKLPFSERSRAALGDMMRARTTPRGALYGKTGSGADASGRYVLGWYVGYVESGGATYAFACALKGSGVMGKDARAAVETALTELGLL